MQHLRAASEPLIWAITQQPGPVLLALACVALAAFLLLYQGRQTPGPSVLLGETLPLLGDTLAVKKDPCGYFLRGYLKYGGVYKTSMLGLPIYVVLEPSAVRELLRGQGVTFSVPFKSFNALLEDWDHMVDSKQHDYWRKAVSTALSPATIESYVPALAAIIRQAIQNWARSGSVSLMQETGDMALEFAIEVLVGVPLQHTDRAWFKARMLQYFKGLYALPLPLPGTTFTQARAAKAQLLAALMRELESHVSGVLQQDPTAGESLPAAAQLERLDGAGKHALVHSDAALQLDQQHLAASMARLKQREAAAAKGTGGSAATAADGSGTGDGYSSASLNMADAQLEVLRAQRRVDAKSAAMRVLGSLIGAVDTTRYQIFSMMAILGQLPDQLDTLRKEQEQVVSSHGGGLTPAALAAMPLLDAALKEVTRLLSAARVVMRQATQPLQLCGVTVPAGSYLILSIDCMHALEPTLWQGPSTIPPGSSVPVYMDWRNRLREAYRPERWLGDADGSSRPKHMMTFGMGAHLCLGMNLVLTEIKLLLALLLREGLAWSFTDSSMLAKMTVFPGLRPAPGTDTLAFIRRYDPL